MQQQLNSVDISALSAGQYMWQQEAHWYLSRRSFIGEPKLKAEFFKKVHCHTPKYWRLWDSSQRRWQFSLVLNETFQTSLKNNWTCSLPADQPINIGADRDENLIVSFVWPKAYNYSVSPTHIHSDTQLLLTISSHGIYITAKRYLLF